MSNDVLLAARGRGLRRYTADEQLLVSRRGEEPPVLVSASTIAIDDWIGVHYGGEWAIEPPLVPRPPDRPLRGPEKSITVPERMTADLALFLGAYFSEGHSTLSNWTVVVTNSVIEVLERVQDACRESFGLEGRIVQQSGRCPGFVVASKRLVELLALLGCGTRASKKNVPDVITASPRDLVLAFLQGAALDAYTCCRGLPRWAICLDTVDGINALQDLVTRLGFTNAQIAKWNKKYEKYYYELYLPSRSGQRFSQLVPFLEPDKQRRALEFQAMDIRGADWTDVVPGLRGPQLYDLIPRGRSGRGSRGTGRQSFRHLCDPRTRHVTRASVRRASVAGAYLPNWLASVMDDNVRFTPVVQVDRLDQLADVQHACGFRPRSSEAAQDVVLGGVLRDADEHQQRLL